MRGLPNMATKFLEPCGDATFELTSGTMNWRYVDGSSTIVTDFVHGNHIKSYRCAPSANAVVFTNNGYFSDTGGRMSFYIYIVALPSSDCSFFYMQKTDQTTVVFKLLLTSTGVLKLYETTNQIGNSGSTLSTKVWYRISFAYTITNSTTNQFRVFKNGFSDISASNVTLTNTGADNFGLGNISTNGTFDIRLSDIYADNDTSLTDTGDIWVMAKRPNANGSTNNFTTQIGAGGSGYGSGHSPQVNERAVSTTNGWSMVGIGNAVTEEYSIESKATGDIDISQKDIVDYMGWVYASSALSETGQMVLAGVNSNISLTSSNTYFTSFAGLTAYPAGGTDIGIITSTTVTTVSLYECGIVVAYLIPKQSFQVNINGGTRLRPRPFAPGLAR